MEKIVLERGTEIFYDIEAKIIGRHPTNSNILETGSDNSLYMGLNNNSDSIRIICSVMGLDNIDDFNQKSLNMSFYGEDVEVQCNINNDGQLQYKIVGNGKMYELLTKYERNIGKIDHEKLLILMDFNNYEIFFEKKEDSSVNNLDIMSKTAKKELIDIIEESKNISSSNEDLDGYIETKLNVRNNYVQRIFRNNLLVEFDGKCAICGINKKELLRASHILPYSKCPSVNEMIDYNNGLLLCINHDELFDKGYISFDYNSGHIIISKEIDNRLYELLNLNNNIVLNKKYLSDKRKKYLAVHKLK